MRDIYQNIYVYIIIVHTLISNAWTRQDHNRYHSGERELYNDLSLWIDEQQVKMVSGFNMKIYAIHNGTVLQHIKDPNFNQYLPIIPSEVSTVNFTWMSRNKKYYYNFDRLESLDENILKAPTISIKTQGKVPSEPKGMSKLSNVFFRSRIKI